MYRDTINANLFRILYCLCLLYTIIRGVKGYDNYYLFELSYAPIPAFKLFQLPQIPFEYIKVIRGVLIVFLTFSIVGIRTRISLLLAAILYFFYYGNALGFTKSIYSDYVHHSKSIGFFLLLLLSLSKEGSLLTLDNLKSHQWNGSDLWKSLCLKKIKFSFIRSAQLLLGISYFASGFVKIYNDPNWIDGYTLQSYLWKKYLLHQNTFTLSLLPHLDLITFASYATIFLELFFVFGIFFKKIRPLVAVAGLLFHLAIWITMKISFGLSFYLVYLVFFDLSHLISKNVPTVAIIRNKFSSTEAVMAFIIVIHLIAALWRIEFWPLSNYGVFVQTGYLDKVIVYRAAYSQKNIDHWLTTKQLPRSKVVYSTLVAHSLKNKHELDLETYRSEIIRKLKHLKIDFEEVKFYKCRRDRSFKNNFIPSYELIQTRLTSPTNDTSEY